MQSRAIILALLLLASSAFGDSFTIIAGSDMYMNSTAATTNYGSATITSIYEDASVGRYRAGFQFPGLIDSLADSSLSYCSLFVHHNATDGTTIQFRVYALLKAFTETEATWNIRKTDTNWTTAGAVGSGTDISAIFAGPFTVGDTNGLGQYPLDITSLVSSMAYNGVLITPVTNSDNWHYLRFDAKQNLTTSKKPQIKVGRTTATTTVRRVISNTTDVKDTYICGMADSTTLNNSTDTGLMIANAFSTYYGNVMFNFFNVFDSIGDGRYVKACSISTNCYAHTFTGTTYSAPVLRPQNIAEATWVIYSTGNNWQTAGAQGAADKGANDGSTSVTGTGRFAVAVDTAAVNALASGDTLKYMLQFGTADMLFFINSMESGDAGDHPQLILVTDTIITESGPPNYRHGPDGVGQRHGPDGVSARSTP